MNRRHRPTIVWGANTHWNSVFQVGAHHLARCFVGMGWRVAYLGAPLIPLSFANRQRSADNTSQLVTWLRGGEWAMDGRLFHYTPMALLANRNRPLLRSRWLVTNWHRFAFPPLGHILRRHGFDTPDLLVVDHPLHSPLRNIVRPRKLLVRVTDNIAAYDAASTAMRDEECVLVHEADLAVHTSKALGPHVAGCKPRRVAYLPNGVAYSMFDRPGLEEPADMADIPRPRAIYVGALDERVDFPLLARCAREAPRVSFVLIGPEAQARARLPQLDNLYLLGKRPHAQVPAYLAASDVGLLPYDVYGQADWINAASSIKLLEYCAAGLPVAAMEYEEIRSLGGVAMLARDAASFCDSVKKLAKEPLTPEQRRKIRTFAAENSWESRTETLLGMLGLTSDAAGMEEGKTL